MFPAFSSIDSFLLEDCDVHCEPRPLLLWPGSLQATQCCRTVRWWRWQTCWRWWVLRGWERSAPGNGPCSSYPHTRPSQGPRSEPAAGCLMAAAHTDQRPALWGRKKAVSLLVWAEQSEHVWFPIQEEWLYQSESIISKSESIRENRINSQQFVCFFCCNSSGDGV